MRLVNAAARSYFPALLRGGVRLYRYQPSVLHSKSMVVDSRWSLVGSANVDIRSFRLNFEVGALVIGEFTAKRLERRFLDDLDDATPPCALAEAAMRASFGRSRSGDDCGTSGDLPCAVFDLDNAGSVDALNSIIKEDKGTAVGQVARFDAPHAP